MKYLFTIIVTLSVCLLNCAVHAAVLTADTAWKGEIVLAEDTLVPAGVTLTIASGTTIKVIHAESTKTDPEYASPLTELTIRGRLIVAGTKNAPVIFQGEIGKPGSWAGIIVDHGMLAMSWCHVQHADTALHVLGGSITVKDSLFKDNRYGLIVQGAKTVAEFADTKITGNDYGVFNLHGATLKSQTTKISGNRKRDAYTFAPKTYSVDAPKRGVSKQLPVARRYSDEVFRGDTIWQGRIEVAGIIRIPEGSRLIVLPGTVVEFTKNDTNGDCLGENGILIQGRIIAKGTQEQPIIFRSAEKSRTPGDWDAINIMNSAAGQNIIEHCQIEDAYRGLHFHFSNVAVSRNAITNCYRAVQFQESLVEMTNNYLYANKSGVQGRDSDITFTDNVIFNNSIGANFFRANLVARRNRIVDNAKEGLRIREGSALLQENHLDGNRQGVMIADMFSGDVSRNSFSGNLENGLSLKNVDNCEVRGNVVAANGLTGINMQETRAVIRNNLIIDNGERGIGVQSLDGSITENNFSGNGSYAIDMDGPGDIAAPDNWWGGVDAEAVIFDKSDDPARGKVRYGATRPLPYAFEWPLTFLFRDTQLRGTIAFTKSVMQYPGTILTIAPGTRLEFSKDTGLDVKGTIHALGKPGTPVLFTSRSGKGPGEWDEIHLEYAMGSVFNNCIIEHATWGIHSHFTDLLITGCTFRNNEGGMRFRSGPVTISNSLFEKNAIGIRAYLGNGVIRENFINNNEIGIFVREKGGGLRILDNNLSANSSYNIRVGDFNNEDIPARDNWWGAADPLQTIFDGRNEPGIGNVLFEPFRRDPLTLKPGATQ